MGRSKDVKSPVQETSPENSQEIKHFCTITHVSVIQAAKSSPVKDENVALERALKTEIWLVYFTCLYHWLNTDETN